jgi:hypothetical protein
MPIDPIEDPPIKPGPTLRAAAREPAWKSEAPHPCESRANSPKPEELPARGPQGPWIQGTMKNSDLYWSSEYVMNKGASGIHVGGNKSKFSFERRHNPA